MRPRAATFCSHCGQDLRDGAPLGATAGKSAPAVRKAGGKARPVPSDGPAADASEPTGTTPTPSQQRTISRPPAAAPEAPASFTERYRGTRFETPESRVAGPPRGWRGALSRRYGRVVGAVTLVVLIAAVALAGASSFLLAGSSASPSPGGSNAAAASSSPGGSAPLSGGTNFSPGERAQIAFCIAAGETHELDAAVAALQAGVKSAQHAPLASAASALAEQAPEMRLAAAEMATQGPLKPYATAYDTGLRNVAKAAGALATAAQASNAKAEGTALGALLAAQKQVHAGDAPRAKALQADPTLACTPAG
jgi:hypothetical protein